MDTDALTTEPQTTIYGYVATNAYVGTPTMYTELGNCSSTAAGVAGGTKFTGRDWTFSGSMQHVIFTLDLDGILHADLTLAGRYVRGTVSRNAYATLHLTPKTVYLQITDAVTKQDLYAQPATTLPDATLQQEAPLSKGYVTLIPSW